MNSETIVAGRELDQRVATEVMGWGWMRAVLPQILPAHRWLVPPEEFGDWGHVRPADMTEPPEDGWWLRLPSEYQGMHALVPCYSTDIAAAWHVVEKMRDTGFEVDVSSDTSTGGWIVLFDSLATAYAGTTRRAATAPLTICLAALAASAARQALTAERA